MKILIFALCWGLGMSAWADSDQVKKNLEELTNCQNSVRLDSENLYLGFGNYKQGFEEPRKAMPGYLDVKSVSTGELWTAQTKDSAIDSVRVGNRLYILTFSSLEEWDLPSRKFVALYPTRQGPAAVNYREHARAMALYKNKLILAHGRMGVTFFDLETKRITNQFGLVTSQLPIKESQAMDVVVQGNVAYVLVDAFSVTPAGQKPPFQGLVKIDLETEKVVSELDGLDPGADALLLNGDQLIVSFMGQPLHKFSVAELVGSRMPEPKDLTFSFGIPGHPTGKPVSDGRYYYTCFVKHKIEERKTERVPLALDITTFKHE